MSHSQDHDDDGSYSTPPRSRFDSRRAGLNKRQSDYRNRRGEAHSKFIASHLRCHKLNGLRRPGKPNPLRHRLLTASPDAWYKKMKIGTKPPWWREKMVRAAGRRARASRKENARRMDGDYVIKRSRELASCRCRSDRKNS